LAEITNTTQRIRENPNPWECLPGLIEASELNGQRELVGSTRLPVDTDEGDDAYISLGFAFRPADPDDPIFRESRSPEGWTRRAADNHAMWSYIVDEHGVDRVAIFYKAAFYDRRAFMRLV
jgi:hypothetical protein